MVQASTDQGAFDKFVFADGMIGQSIVDAIGDDLEGAFGTSPGSNNKGTEMFVTAANSNGIDGDGPFDASSYNAAALLALAMQAASSMEGGAIQAKVMAVANAPGAKNSSRRIGQGPAVAERKTRHRLRRRDRR